MHLTESLNNRWHRLIDGEDLMPLYWNVLLRNLGVEMMSLFTPVFVFLLGMDKLGGFVGGVRLVAGYVLLERLLTALISIGVMRVIERIGFRRAIAIGSLSLAAFFAMPVVFDKEIWVVLVMAVISSVATTFYWNSRLSMMSMDYQGSKLGREVGVIHLLGYGVGILAPFAGGVLVFTGGFELLFAVGATVIFLSSLPVFFMKHHKKTNGVSWPHFVRWVLNKSNWDEIMAFVGSGWDGMVNGFLWPVYFYLVVGNLEKLGILTSLALLVGGVSAFVAGKVFDKNVSKEKMFVVFGHLLAGFRLLRLIPSNWMALFGVDLATKMVSPNYYVPFDGYLFVKGREQNTLEFYAYRETIFSLAIVSVCIVCIVFAGSSIFWSIMFIVSAIGVLMGLKIKM